MHIKVVTHESNWAVKYEDEAAQIRKILGGQLINIFHIGSTSVPGLEAKPLIDIMPVVADIKKVDELNASFETLGYEPMGEYGIPGRRFFRKGGDNRTHHIHVFQFDNLWDIMRHLSFRDYLRAHPDICRKYASLKVELALKFPEDIQAYCDGKDEFIKRTEQDAVKWYLSRRQ